jgi:hypothetical protein
MTDTSNMRQAPRTESRTKGRALTPSPTASDAKPAPEIVEGDWWGGVKRAAVRWRLTESPQRRLTRAVAALLSLTPESREVLIDHLVMTWGRDVLMRRLSLGWKDGGDDDR